MSSICALTNTHKVFEQKRYQRMYNEATDAIIEHLTKVSEPSKLVYFSSKDAGNTINTMDHLSCFAGAMFALGAYHCFESKNSD